MDVPQRVHVVPLGYEYDRILEPVTAMRADLVYVLLDERQSATYHDDLLEELERAVRTVETVACDLGDVYAVLGTVTTLAARHAADDVRVNVSGGGTIAAIGATIACMDVDTDATAYYVKPEGFAHEGSSAPASVGMADLSQLPTYPIASPSPEQVAIMEFLADPTRWDGFDERRTAPPKKKDLIAYGRDEGLPFMADRTPPDGAGGEDKGAFRVLDTRILDPLETDGYVRLEQRGRRYAIELTERGENAYRAFRHKLEYGGE
ncbi:HFX_2341 family transcriptional regulator domain-containing protein [Natronobiforma cellulositropha]|uniref:HFX_2341 family transcriptional regulator domain-containing protein n=1 Tax=Natronobiforma cellulositropha TaxID=1679076 RepID=UPI0021D57F99|nr:DUF6293 family protein [Natronobiforma cellulositropha]